MSSDLELPPLPGAPPAPSEVRQPEETLKYNRGDADEILTEEDLVKLMRGKTKKQAWNDLLALFSGINLANAFRKAQDPDTTIADHERLQAMMTRARETVFGKAPSPAQAAIAAQGLNGVNVTIDTGGGPVAVMPDPTTAAEPPDVPPVPPMAGAFDEVRMVEGGVQEEDRRRA